jgi:polyisoprenoid-binding protein YceI
MAASKFRPAGAASAERATDVGQLAGPDKIEGRILMIDPILRFRPALLTATVLVLAAMMAACGGAPPTAEAPSTDPAIAAPTSTAAGQTAQVTLSPTDSNTPAAANAGSLRLTLADSGNEARYLVREQLAALSFPSDAIGKTTDMSGALVVSPDGAFVSGESKIVVQLASIRTDEDRRDNYVRQRVLETARYPEAIFVPKEARGLDVSALRSGETTFELVGDMTVHGATEEVVWNVTASLSGDSLTGTATTEFTFEDFGMTVPSVMVVLSVEDRIRLEYDFSFVLENG